MNSLLRASCLAVMVTMLLSGCATPVAMPSNDLRAHIVRQQAEIATLNRRIEELELRLRGVSFRVTPNTVQTLPLSGFGQ